MAERRSATGHVLEVHSELRGAEIAADSPASTNPWPLTDVTDFDENGGQLELQSAATGVLTVLSYTKVDDAANTITLSAPLAQAVVEGDQVHVYPRSRVKYAVVSVDDADEEPLLARVSHPMRPLLPTGVRDTVYEAVDVELNSDDEWVVTDVRGAEDAVISESELTDITAAEPFSDGVAPAASPAPTIVGGPSFIAARWAAAANADPVTYEVHVSTVNGFAPDATTKYGETQATIAIIKTLPSGAALAYGTTYYVKVIAKDLDGAAAASAQGSGAMVQVANTDVAASAITLDKISPLDRPRLGNLWTNGNAEASATLNWQGALTWTSRVAPTDPVDGTYVWQRVSTAWPANSYDYVVPEEYIPVDTSTPYLIAAWMRRVDALENNALLGISCLDKQLRNIDILNYYSPNPALMTLTAQANPGDTALQVDSTAVMGAWVLGNYAALGAQADFSDLPNFNSLQIGSTTATTIALNQPVVGTWPIGTKVRWHQWGGTYAYAGGAKLLTTAWQRLSGIIQGVVAYNEQHPNKFRPGTAFIRPVVLFAYGAGAGTRTTQFDAATFEVATDTVRITDNAITAPKIVADAVIAGKIAADAVTAREIAAGSITTEKLTVASLGDSAIANGSFEDAQRANPTMPASWTSPGYGSSAGDEVVALATDYIIAGSKSLKLVGSYPSVVSTPLIPVVPGDVWYLALTARAAVAFATGLYVRGRDQNGADVTAGLENVGVGTSQTRLEGTLTIPAGVTSLRIYAVYYKPSNGNVVTTGLWLDDVVLRKVTVSAQIGAGAITTPKLAAGAVAAGKIAADAVTSAEILAGSITASDMQVGTITAASGILADAVVTTAKIALLAVGTAQIADLGVTSAKIGNLQVTDAKISSLTVDKIVSGTLSADVTITGTIKTAATGQRVVIDSSGIKLKDSGGNNTVQLDAATGNATIIGTFATDFDTSGNARIAIKSGVDKDRIQFIGGSGNHVDLLASGGDTIKIMGGDLRWSDAYNSRLIQQGWIQLEYQGTAPPASAIATNCVALYVDRNPSNLNRLAWKFKDGVSGSIGVTGANT